MSNLGLVIVAAGSSHRMGGVDKVWAEAGGRPLLTWSLTHLSPLAARCVIVVRPDRLAAARQLLRSVPDLLIVAGGSDRQESVSNGILALNGVDLIGVHDAARPFATAQLLASLVNALDSWDGAVPVVPVHDTIKRVDERGGIVATVDRTTLRAAQTPQVFRADTLRVAHEKGRRQGVLATDDASLLEITGGRVGTVPGDPLNFKVTTALHLEVVRFLLDRQHRA